MGKIRTRIIGLENLEMEQKEEQKKKSQIKAASKKVDAKSEAAVEAVQESAEEVQAEAPVEAKKETKKESKKESVVTVEQKGPGKKHKAALKKVDEKKTYSIADAVALLKKIKYAGFDETVELHLNVRDSGMRGEISLPHTTGRSVRVAIVSDAVLEKLDSGVIDFDILITHPSFMPKLAKFARTLGPKGLMPNPKAGTITTNPEEVAKKYSGGLLKWKGEAKFPLVHQMIGKISQDDVQITENAVAFMKTIGHGNITQAVIKTTMSPGLKIAVE